MEGDKAREFLRHLVANNVAKLKTPGKAIYSCMLNETGGVIDDLIVYWRGEKWFRIVVNAGTADKDIVWMHGQAEPYGVKLAPRRELAMIAMQGPNARQKVWDAMPGLQDVSAAIEAFQCGGRGRACSWPAPATLGRTDLRSCCPVKAAEFFWRSLMEQGPSRADWARATPCGWKQE